MKLLRHIVIAVSKRSLSLSVAGSQGVALSTEHAQSPRPVSAGPWCSNLAEQQA